MNTKDKLKPCPFCGGKTVETHIDAFSIIITVFECTNENCKAEVSFRNDDCKANTEKAIEAWNRRAEQ